jgi:RNA polymerase sigma factor (sigma-70 family)
MIERTDKETFLNLVQENRRIIYKIGNLYCKDKVDIEDLAQEIIYQLWKSWGSFDAKAKFTTWMYRIALNVASSFYRKDRRRQESHEPIAEHLIEMPEDSLSGETESNINLLMRFINELAALDKALMILYLEENSYREIAEVLGISETNVATRIGRTKEKLKKRFQIINN